MGGLPLKARRHGSLVPGESFTQAQRASRPVRGRRRHTVKFGLIYFKDHNHGVKYHFVIFYASVFITFIADGHQTKSHL